MSDLPKKKKASPDHFLSLREKLHKEPLIKRSLWSQNDKIKFPPEGYKPKK